MDSGLATVVVAGIFRGIVVLVALAAAISEWTAHIGLIVIEPAFKVALTWSFFHRLIAGSCKQTYIFIQSVAQLYRDDLRVVSLTAQND